MSPQSVQRVASTEILDVEGSLARFGGDEQLFLDMTTMLLEDAPELYSQLEAAVLRSDAGGVEAKAHAIKGLVANCGGKRAAWAAQVLEDAGHRGDLSNASEFAQSLQTELDILTSAIRTYQQ